MPDLRGLRARTSAGSLRKRGFARNHLREPWLWDHDWRLEPEAAACRTRSLLAPFLLCAPAALLAGGFMVSGVVSTLDTSGGGARFLFLAIALGAGGVAQRWLWKTLCTPTLRGWRGRRHFGVVRLRLPQVPLDLGTTERLEVLFPRDVLPVAEPQPFSQVR
ncbi:hypothetical protein JY651_27770 [Pyxidicoccus parkwayensis]|uniref:Uncharacterized protein n=1 Tax=Pyxidicoccus parkwayensis TaxID=2813578 RepID=A0ABX7NNV5_9BACT|nr:hypothetical protein [Pyxidicoccus parkwaysis]QSQ19144.1 hypothetical protein JY651_27770 [Pyxidicoccus parkwaysis]